MQGPLASVRATKDEVSSHRAGDEIVPSADVVMDTGFDLEAVPEVVWPWIVQLGKRRAGWYLPRWVERFVPPSRRAARGVVPQWQRLAVGDVIPDYGGRDETFEVVEIEPVRHLVYRSTRGRTDLTWTITLTAQGPGAVRGTRVHLRLRLGAVRRVWLAENLGGWFDALTIAAMAAGLRERVPARS